MDDATYQRLFAGDKGKEALKVALDVRKFEIELYWKRATYFWAFIAATFVGYNTVQGDPGKGFTEMVLSSLGLLLSLGWLLANRGSKQWQENWEHHVDHLEDHVTGPLYKTTLPRSRPNGLLAWLDFITVGPSKHSVSKINQMISLYILILWCVLLVRSLPKAGWSVEEVVVAGLTGLGCIGLLIGTRTYSGPQGHNMHIRESRIE